jgi:hypothetical protein
MSVLTFTQRYIRVLGHSFGAGTVCMISTKEADNVVKKRTVLEVVISKKA